MAQFSIWIWMNLDDLMRKGRLDLWWIVKERRVLDCEGEHATTQQADKLPSDFEPLDWELGQDRTATSP